MKLCYQEFGYGVIQFSRRVLLLMWGGGVLMILDVGVLCWRCATGWGGVGTEDPWRWGALLAMNHVLGGGLALKIPVVGVLCWR